MALSFRVCFAEHTWCRPQQPGPRPVEQLASRCHSLQGLEALRTSAVLQKPKTVTLRALCSQRKFGVVGRSCREVLHKGCLRFQLPEHGSRLCLYEDGMELTEDYFPSVLDNAELLLLTPGQACGLCESASDTYTPHSRLCSRPDVGIMLTGAFFFFFLGPVAPGKKP
uniref:DNA fragmentation factor subunit beta n=1 Tax=Theropithecus gelada TaxID=9565 RepID=A0A8D2F525_THEGE